jgi:hypothetical protein
MSALTQEIIDESNFVGLLAIQIELAEKLSDLHLQKQQPDCIHEEVTANIRTAYTQLELVKRKIVEFEREEKIIRNREMRIKHNFMRIAKAVLTGETYKKIRDMALGPLYEAKPHFPELRKNKVEE